MRTYNTPEEPTGPVWDKDGYRWERTRNGAWLREGGIWTYSADWYLLLHRYGPLFDLPQVKVGNKVTLNEFSKMPEGSIAGAPWDVYIVYGGRVYTDAQVWVVDLPEFGDDLVTVLRVGDGEDHT